MANTWFRSPAVIAAIIGGMSLLIATILTNLSKQSDEPPTKDDIAYREQLREILTENQSINSQYAEFHKTDLRSSNITFREIDTIYGKLLTKKRQFLDKLQNFKPTKRYTRLHSLMNESIISDSTLFFLEQEGFRSMVGYLQTLESIPKLDTTNLTKEQIRERAFETIMDFQKKNREWLDRSKERSAKEKVAKANSFSAIEMLNDEMKRENLPYTHTNVFQEIPELPKQPTDTTYKR